MLTDADLTSMRATAAEALPGTAVISSQAWVSDGGGGGSQAWTPAGTVACRIAPISGSEREMAERISPDAQLVVTLPFDAEVEESSRLIISGETYNVEAIRDRTWNVSTRVEVVRET